MDLTNANWRKSSHSGDSSEPHCVELARLPGAIAMRDSKDPDGPVLLLTPRTLSEALREQRHA